MAPGKVRNKVSAAAECGAEAWRIVQISAGCVPHQHNFCQIAMPEQHPLDQSTLSALIIIGLLQVACLLLS